MTTQTKIKRLYLFQIKIFLFEKITFKTEKTENKTEILLIIIIKNYQHKHGTWHYKLV